ncbi:MAG: hypothetical protein NUV56_00060 [Candidatus Uhrbacteria bacterium]|nr:hypothetical protein [Candidatus Uhrbacteria bacterium]
MNTAQKVIVTLWILCSVAGGVYSFFMSGTDAIGALIVMLGTWLAFAIPMVILIMLWSESSPKRR